MSRKPEERILHAKRGGRICKHSAVVVWRAEVARADHYEDFDLAGVLVCGFVDGVQEGSYTLQRGHMEDKA